MKLLKLKSGSFSAEQGTLAEDGTSLTKRALMVYAGQFDSMEGPVTVKDEHIEKLFSTHNDGLKLAAGEPQMKDYPPIQLDHSTSAKDTVGRLVGPLEIGEHTLKDGTKVKALYGNVKILGKENVDKVQDGRWTNLSIGADLEGGKVSELTITPFPAAAEASLLSKPNSQGEPMKEKMKKHLMEHYKMSDEQAEAHMARCAKHLMDKEKLASEEDAYKKFEGMDDESMHKMAAEVKDADDKLAADTAEKEKKEKEAKDKETKMAAAKTDIAKLATDFRTTHKNAELAAKKISINTKLSKLRADAKITPAEIKKIDLAKLAGETDATVAAVLKTYEDREPVIMTSLTGNKKATTLASVHKAGRISRLEAETRANMPLLARVDEQKRLSGEAVTPGQEALPPKPEHMTEESHKAEMEADIAQHHKLLDEGKIPEAKEHLKAMMEKHFGYGSATMGGEVASSEKEMSALAESMKQMHTQVEQVMQLASTLAGDDKK